MAHFSKSLVKYQTFHLISIRSFPAAGEVRRLTTLFLPSCQTLALSGKSWPKKHINIQCVKLLVIHIES